MWIPKYKLAGPALLIGWLCLGTLALLPQNADASMHRVDEKRSCQIATTIEKTQRLDLIPAGYFHQSDFSTACSLWKHLELGGPYRPPASSFVPGVVHDFWLDVNRRVADAKQLQQEMFNSIRNFVGLDR